MPSDVDDTARIVDSTLGNAELREFVTVHDSSIGDDCRVYERCSLKNARVSDAVDVNAGSYVENAEIGPRVQVGPNCSVVGVTHSLGETGMEFRNDVFDRIVLNEGVFLGAGAVVGPGVEIGAGTVVGAGATVVKDVGPGKLVRGTPPAQEVTPLDAWLSG